MARRLGGCSASFPLPARRTGRAVLPHPAHRFDSAGLRPQRLAADRADQILQAVLLVQSKIGRARTPLPSVLSPQPPAEPAAGVLLHRLPGSRDVAQPKVVPPAQQKPVQERYRRAFVAPRRSAARRSADLLADRLHFALGRIRRKIPPTRSPRHLHAELETQEPKRLGPAFSVSRPVPPAALPFPATRSSRRSGRPRPEPRHWRGNARRRTPARRFDRSCRAVDGSELGVALSLSPAAPSEARLKLLNLRRVSDPCHSPRLSPLRLSALSVLLEKQGSFPPPALTGFAGTTNGTTNGTANLSDSRLARPVPRGLPVRPARTRRQDGSLAVACRSPCRMPSSLPRQDVRRPVALGAVRGVSRPRPSPYVQRVGSRNLHFRGLLDVHSRYGLHTR